jgi:hypothetical protein
MAVRGPGTRAAGTRGSRARRSARRPGNDVDAPPRNLPAGPVERELKTASSVGAQIRNSSIAHGGSCTSKCTPPECEPSYRLTFHWRVLCEPVSASHAAGFEASRVRFVAHSMAGTVAEKLAATADMPREWLRNFMSTLTYPVPASRRFLAMCTRPIPSRVQPVC